jgi:hypothetical protein
VELIASSADVMDMSTQRVSEKHVGKATTLAEKLIENFSEILSNNHFY